MEKRVFNPMAVAVQMGVILPRPFPVPVRRDLDLHALGLSLCGDGIAVIAFIGDQVRGTDAFNQLPSLRAIRPGTFCSHDSERHTMRIHGQMYLGIELPLARLIP